MLLLKHVRDWSYEVLSREVRANLVYREFTRIGGGKVPDDRTMGNLARQLGPEVIEKLHRRVVGIAQEKQIATGRKMRVDTTVVETDIHYPTDSTLLGDGMRVSTRIMKKVTAVAGKAGTQMRDRSRSAKLKVLANRLVVDSKIQPRASRPLSEVFCRLAWAFRRTSLQSRLN